MRRGRGPNRALGWATELRHELRVEQREDRHLRAEVSTRSPPEIRSGASIETNGHLGLASILSTVKVCDNNNKTLFQSCKSLPLSTDGSEMSIHRRISSPGSRQPQLFDAANSGFTSSGQFGDTK